jgi:hypothetical protein
MGYQIILKAVDPIAHSADDRIDLWVVWHDLQGVRENYAIGHAIGIYFGEYLVGGRITSN